MDRLIQGDQPHRPLAHKLCIYYVIVGGSIESKQSQENTCINTKFLA